MKTIEELLADWEEGTLTPEGVAELKRRLEAPEARRELVDEWLLREAIYGAVRTNSPQPVAAAPQRMRRIVVLALAAGIALIIGLGVFFQVRQPAVNSPPPMAAVPQESTSTAVAVLTSAVEVRWSDSATPRRVGEALEPGWLKLDAGIARIEFFSGARVMIEGPAELRLISPAEAFCASGRLSADVPPQAQGFRIGTPQASVVDLGTSFGITVGSGGSEVHVFKGEVQVNKDAAQPQGLTEGQALAIQTGGGQRQLPANPAAFASAEDIERRTIDAQRLRQQRWQAAVAQLQSDPALLIWYDFESGGADRTMHNLAPNAAPATNGAIIGCGWTGGRWPGKRALDFRNLSDRIRLTVPGSHRSITLAAWVRVHGLDRTYNSLFMSDAFNPGAVHWQITSGGKVRLGIANSTTPWQADYDSPMIFTPQRLGQWVHLAVVYDAEGRRVSHFVDGEPVSRTAMRFDIPLRIEHVEVGNWNVGTRSPESTPIRHFSGRMDELGLFARALGEAEIQRLFEAGSPQLDAPAVKP